MTALTDTTGALLPITLPEPSFADDFKRADGPIGNGWLDLATVWPNRYDRAVIGDNSFAVTPATANLDPSGPGDDLVIGHWTIARRFPLTDNFAVSIRYSYQGFSQINPCAFLDPTAADKLEVGYKWVDDSGFTVRPTYAQNVFRTDGPGVADCLYSPWYYRPGPASIDNHARPPTRPVESVTMRVVGGRTSLVWDGVRRGPATGSAIPAYCFDGREMMVGIDIIGIQIKPGRIIAGFEWGPVQAERVVGFTAGPYDGPL